MFNILASLYFSNVIIALGVSYLHQLSKLVRQQFIWFYNQE
jgi:hypothetical protein